MGAELGALNADLRAAGAWVFAAGLHPPGTATVVRAGDGDPLITDGCPAAALAVVDGLDLDRHHLGGGGFTGRISGGGAGGTRGPGATGAGG